MSTGEEQAWGILSRLESENVCKRAKVAFDRKSAAYILSSFSQDIFVSPQTKEIYGSSALSAFLLKDLAYYSRLSILWYLVGTKDIPLSGELVKPYNIAGGQIFTSGSHKLPLDKIAQKYGCDPEGFLKRGKELGGEQASYADASLQLSPFPRIPVTLLLWVKDEEFDAGCDLLLNSTCEAHLPADIIWATSMMTLLIMLEA
jgi:hypothetical protein